MICIINKCLSHLNKSKKKNIFRSMRLTICLVLIIINTIMGVAAFWYFDSVRNFVYRYLPGKHKPAEEEGKKYNQTDDDDGDSLKYEKTNGDSLKNEKPYGDGLKNEKPYGDGLKNEKPYGDGFKNEKSNGYGFKNEKSNGYGFKNEKSNGYGFKNEKSNGDGLKYEMSNGDGLKYEMSNGDGLKYEMSNGFGLKNEKPNGDGLKYENSNCDGLKTAKYNENILLLNLAQLYILSPEHILHLVTNEDLKGTCQNIREVLADINCTVFESTPCQSENLYMRLYKGLKYFEDTICKETRNFWYTYLNNNHECIDQLRIDLIECEGPPDWFESTNKAEMCQHYKDITNCQFYKTAILCGLKVAQLLRKLSAEIMQSIVPIKCKVSRSLPDADSGMPPASDAPVGRSITFWDAKNLKLLSVNHLTSIVLFNLCINGFVLSF